MFMNCISYCEQKHACEDDASVSRASSSVEVSTIVC